MNIEKMKKMISDAFEKARREEAKKAAKKK